MLRTEEVGTAKSPQCTHPSRHQNNTVSHRTGDWAALSTVPLFSRLQSHSASFCVANVPFLTQRHRPACAAPYAPPHGHIFPVHSIYYQVYEIIFVSSAGAGLTTPTSRGQLAGPHPILSLASKRFPKKPGPHALVICCFQSSSCLLAYLHYLS